MNNKNMRKDNIVSEIISKCNKMLFAEKDINSVSAQLDDLIYKDMIYRSFNEGLRIDKGNESIPKELIGMFHELFFANQVINTRRLLDRGKDVHSLRRVFDIIYENKEVFTRRGFLFANQYQLEKFKVEEMKMEQLSFLNALYDCISNKSSESIRNDEDKLDNSFLNSIHNFLNTRSIIHEYTNTFVAHSLNKRKRKITENDLKKITLNKLQKEYKIISWLTYTLSKYIGNLILFEVPTVVYDQFEGWSGSIYKMNIDHKLYHYWDKRRKLFENWKNMYWKLDSIYITPTKQIKITAPDRA